MSILLDALRKSERQQRKGALPDIHAEDPPVATSGAGGSRTWVLATLGVLIFGILAWFGWSSWQAYRVPTAEPEFTDLRPEPSRQGSSPAGPAVPEDSGPSSSSATDQQSRQSQQTPSRPDATAARDEETGTRLSRQPRSPVETLSTDQPLQSAVTLPAEHQPAPARAAASPAAAPDQPTDAQKRRQEQLALLEQAVETTGVPEEERRAAPRGARTDRSSTDGAISFWQLPEGTRNSLPELRINVMVYDQDPSKRFIIMGGKRYLEGAQVSSNLKLETVERDRALFRNGAYLFYVKQ